MVTRAQRLEEAEKYRQCYNNPNLTYAMGAARLQDARRDLSWAREMGCNEILDVGCGRGEMLAYAETLGFQTIFGTEVVLDLTGERVMPVYAHELVEAFGAGTMDLVTCFDVIEHLHPGDDIALLKNMATVARKALIITANNKRSVDPFTGNDLHINKRPYDEWDDIIRAHWSEWDVHRCTDKQYVSETWRATR